jgi:uncharacterized protein (TIGR02646 family)
MIHIERTEEPGELQSPMVRSWRQRARRFFKRPYAMRSQERFPFEQVELLPQVVEALKKMSHEKCAYCESKVVFPEFDIANHRPRSGALELAGAISPDHYWWLAYEWFNLYLVCTVCNRLKGNRFPLGSRRAEHLASEADIKKEAALLFDPCVDFPEDELIFDGYGNVASESKRGRVTIDSLNLNRTDLVSRRAKELDRLLARWKHAIETHGHSHEFSKEAMESLYHPDLEFLALRRQYLQQFSLTFIEKHPEWEAALKPFLSFRTALKHQLFSFNEVSPNESIPLSAQTSSSAVKGAIKKTVENFQAHQVAQENYSLEDSSQKEQYFAKTRLIERIEISNFKVIQQLSLHFPLASQERGSWLLLLGENGTGKSSVLQAVALALMGDKARKKLDLNDASRFVRYGCKKGYVRLHLTGSSTPIELKFNVNSKNFETNTPEPKVLMLGYGATRLLPRKGSPLAKDSPYSKADNLFDPFTALNDAISWLYGLDDKTFDHVALALKELMLLDANDRLLKTTKTSEKKIQIKAFGGRVFLEDLSAGYQSVLALSTDIMSVLLRLWDAVRFAEGIVLVDEIDAHLHPRWKMQIVNRLRQTFPRVQFLVTSHEPLTLRGLQAGEVAVMTRDAENHINAITEDLPNPSALRIDQLLTSEYFGLNSTISPELEAKFDEYYALLALRKPSQPQKHRVAELKKELDGLRLMGSTPRERIMLEEADRFLAKKAQATPETKQKLKTTTRKKILRMWEKLD